MPWEGETGMTGRARCLCSTPLKLLLLLGLGVPLGLIVGSSGDKGQPLAAAPAAQAPPLPAESAVPGITMKGFHVEILEEGRRTSLVKARHGRLEPQTGSIKLNGMELDFYEEGQMVGQAISPAGRLWLRPDEAQRIGRNDVLLWEEGNRQVLYRDETSILRSPRIRLFYEQGLLRSDKFERVFKIQDNWVQTTGERIEILLETGNNPMGGERIREINASGTQDRQATWKIIEKPDWVP